MSFLDQITVMILTYNEAPNIGRTLAELTWAKQILIVDSGSADETLSIVSRCPQTNVLTRAFSDFAGQCNFGLSHVTSEWVLSLDADYVLSAEIRAELGQLATCEEISGYNARFIYQMHGHSLRGTLYPPRTVLYRKAQAKYQNEGHGHRVAINGRIQSLRGPIYHDDRKPLSRWFASQQNYAALEARYLLQTPPAKLRFPDKLRRMAWPAPLLVFFYALIVKRCILDGWPGWLYVLQRTLAEIMVAIEIVDHRLQAPNSKADL